MITYERAVSIIEKALDKATKENPSSGFTIADEDGKKFEVACMWLNSKVRSGDIFTLATTGNSKSCEVRLAYPARNAVVLAKIVDGKYSKIIIF